KSHPAREQYLEGVRRRNADRPKALEIYPVGKFMYFFCRNTHLEECLARELRGDSDGVGLRIFSFLALDHPGIACSCRGSPTQKLLAQNLILYTNVAGPSVADVFPALILDDFT